MPTPITSPNTRNGEAKDLPAYATPHGQPWFRVTDWGDGVEVDEVFGPEVCTLAAMAASFYLAWQEEHADEVFKKDVAEKRRLSQKKSAEIHSEDSDRRESRVMTTSTNSVLIGGAGPGAPMAPAVAVKPMSVDEKNRAIRARAVAEAKK